LERFAVTPTTNGIALDGQGKRPIPCRRAQSCPALPTAEFFERL
jgi:hypothetical protein